MRKLSLIIIALIIQVSGMAQHDSTLFKRVKADTGRLLMNMDAIYNRPFLQVGKAPVALGGYLEANTNYSVTDGVTEGFSFQMQRMTLFLSSTISRRIRFLSELEFEDGTKEINIEFAALDFEFHPLLTFRGGIIMNPIGAFNQNHDGPKWEFIDRPISATQMLPATWSNVGFGLHGKRYSYNWVFAYEVYLSNGFDDQIIANSQNKTFLPATKLNRDRFEESPTGIPMITSKIAIRRRSVGEIGLSYMGGVYNTFRQDGIVLDEKRRTDTWAVDLNTSLPTGTYITGEFAFVHVNVPDQYTQQYGTRQHGGFLDIVHPVVRQPLFGYERSVINLAVRLEYVDWNGDALNETGGKIADDVFAIVPGISFRPTAQTVFRLNYRYQQQRDFLGNPPSKTAAIQFGFSSYF